MAIEALSSGADFYLQKGGDLEAQFAELRNIVLKLARNRTDGEFLEQEQGKVPAAR